MSSPTNTTVLFDAAEVRRTFSLFVKRRSVFEVRVLDAQLHGDRRRGPVSGYFSDIERCLSQLARLTGFSGVYRTLNPVNPALLSRRANRLELAGRNANTGDSHIVRRDWLLIDTDPERPAGISSTDSEKEAAKQKALEIRRWLKEEGWPQPVPADSGNGYHLIYMVDLPADDNGLIEKFLAGLALRFNGDGVEVDTTVFNASRIVKLHGTLAAKGDNTEERPHRMSRLLKVPDKLEPVSIEQIEAAVKKLLPPNETRAEATRKSRDFDVDDFLARHGVEAEKKFVDSLGRTIWRLKQCVFNSEHVNGQAAIVQQPGGILGYECKHTSCVEKHWADFRRHLEPDYDARRGTPKVEVQLPAAEWQDPQPLPEEMPGVPPFNYDCLPESQRPWIEDISERMQCPPEFPAIGAVIALCSLIGRKLGIKPKQFDDWLLIANLWGCVVGPPGVMKTPGLQQVLSALRRLIALAFDKYEGELLKYKTAQMLHSARKKVAETEMVKHLRDKEEDAAREKANSFTGEEAKQQPPICRRHEINDATIEKLGVILSENPNGVLLFRDEIFGLWCSLDREDRAGDRAIYLEMWDGLGQFVYDRIERGTVRIPSNTLSMLGGITPDLLTQYVRETVRGGVGNDGFLQRYQLFAWPDISKEFRNVDRWPDNKAKNEAFEVFKYLDELRPKDVGATIPEEGIPFLRFTLEAQECFNAWRVDLEKRLRSGSEHPAFLAHLAKYKKLIPALALFNHLADRGRGPVVLDALNRALLWARDLEVHALRIYSAVTRSGKIAARQLAKHLLRGDLGERFTMRQVHQKDWSGLTEKEDVEEATDILCDLGWIWLDVEASRRVPGTPGRSPGPIFEVNPRIFAGTPVIQSPKSAEYVETPSEAKKSRVPPSTPPSKSSKPYSERFEGDLPGGAGDFKEPSEAPDQQPGESEKYVKTPEDGKSGDTPTTQPSKPSQPTPAQQPSPPDKAPTVVNKKDVGRL